MAALVVETPLYGIFLVLFFAIRLSKQVKSKSRFAGAVLWPTSVEVSLLGIIVTATAVDALSCVSGDHGPRGQPRDNGLGAVFIALLTRLHVFQTTKNALSVFFMLAGDQFSAAIFVRCFSRWIGMMVSGLVAVSLLYRSSPDALQVTFNWVFANFILSTMTSIYCTAWRIWKGCRESAGLHARKIISVLTVLLESAAIWTSWTIVFVALHEIGSPAELPIAVCIPAVTGIVNTVIHLRVAVGLGPGRTWRPTGTGTPDLLRRMIQECTSSPR
ncbi:hypothetical protein K438DRAFT_2026550 [Mycena galopus ATCC 62051]|nr:hypothetical protein K438DRAFT_2026550 [Mycena galopus ATCC 62051]